MTLSRTRVPIQHRHPLVRKFRRWIHVLVHEQEAISQESTFWDLGKPCRFCGHMLPLDANFCSDCGFTQRGLLMDLLPQLAASLQASRLPPTSTVSATGTTGPQHIVTQSLPRIRKAGERPKDTYNRAIAPVLKSIKTGDLDG